MHTHTRTRTRGKHAKHAKHDKHDKYDKHDMRGTPRRARTLLAQRDGTCTGAAFDKEGPT